MRDIALEQHSAPKFFRKNRRFVGKKIPARFRKQGLESLVLLTNGKVKGH